MSKIPNKKMIGLFTFVGILIFISFMVLFLKDKLFIREKDLLVMYFDESIKGLSIGSPVVLKGVELGKVVRIDMVANVEDLSFSIPVYVKINSDQVITMHDKPLINQSHPLLRRLVEKGMRARLATQNFLTGQLMIELEVDPDSPAVFKGDGSHKEIPTVLSSLGELSKGLQDLPIRQSLDRFNDLLEQATKLAENANKIVNNSSGDAANTIDNLNKTIKDVGEAAQSLRNFSDYIERHPEALLKGKGGY